jgi:hypothetical protein
MQRPSPLDAPITTVFAMLSSPIDAGNGILS